METVQRIEKFFTEGTLGSADESLENTITRMNEQGWKVDQIVPISFRPSKYSKRGLLEVVSGILLCSKIE